MQHELNAGIFFGFFSTILLIVALGGSQRIEQYSKTRWPMKQKKTLNGVTSLNLTDKRFTKPRNFNAFQQ